MQNCRMRGWSEWNDQALQPCLQQKHSLELVHLNLGTSGGHGFWSWHFTSKLYTALNLQLSLITLTLKILQLE